MAHYVLESPHCKGGCSTLAAAAVAAPAHGRLRSAWTMCRSPARWRLGHAAKCDVLTAHDLHNQNVVKAQPVISHRSGIVHIYFVGYAIGYGCGTLTDE